MISRILKSLMKWYNTRPYSKTLVHFISLCAFSAVFFGLTSVGVFEKAPINVPPVEYHRLDARMTGEQLEQKLRTRSADVKELIFFKGTKAVAVLGAPGFEQEKIIPRIDPDLIRTMAKDANVPVRELDSIKVANPEGSALTFVWWVLLIAQITALAFILFKSPGEGMPNIVKHTFETLADKHAAFFHHRKLRRSRLHRAAWIVTMVLLCLAFGCRFFLNQPIQEVPQEYSFHQQSTRWQVERHLKIAPGEFQRAAVIDGTSTMYVQILPAAPADKVEVRKPAAEQPARGVYRGAPSRMGEIELPDAAAEQVHSPEDLPMVQVEVPVPATTTTTTGDTATKEITPISRLLKFSNDAAGQAEMNALVASLSEAKVPVRHIEAALNTNIFTTMPKLWTAILAIWSVLMVLWGIVIISFWNSWREAEGETVTKSAVAAGGRGGSSAGAEVEVRDEDKKTFADVAGCQEAIDELRVVEKKIRRPRIYKIFGAPVPAGVMMYGPPGTGKTLLARALAGEIGGHFKALSGSQFVEMYVGVGAKRVREAYSEARKAAKRTGRISIVFIDEIDAIAKKRGSGGEGGGDKEYEQTLNELLVQMNGFGNHGLVLTMAATNRLDILDEAILRPGRFDIKVQVPKPDKKGRAQIYGVYLKKLKIVMPEEGDREAMMAKLLDDLARRSHDFSGAEIEGAIKNGATIAVERQFGDVTEDITEEQMEEYREKAIITVDDLNVGVDKMAYGTQIKSRVRTDKERKATAIHEIGHACVPTVMGGDPVNRITIVMTDKSLGLMDSSPEEGERYDWTDEQFRIRLRMMLAGRAAEKILLGKISTGASNDFERASQLARQMVGVYGMSEEFGVKSIPLDRYGFPASNIGDLLKKFNDAWGKIIDDAEKATDEIIEKHRGQIEAAAEVLYDNETMTGDEFRQIWKENEHLVKVEESAGESAAVDSAQA